MSNEAMAERILYREKTLVDALRAFIEAHINKDAKAHANALKTAAVYISVHTRNRQLLTDSAEIAIESIDDAERLRQAALDFPEIFNV